MKLKQEEVDNRSELLHREIASSFSIKKYVAISWLMSDLNLFLCVFGHKFYNGILITKIEDTDNYSHCLRSEKPVLM
jgi:hypothetical protein